MDWSRSFASSANEGSELLGDMMGGEGDEDETR